MEGECCKQLHSACVKSSSRSTVVEYNVTCRGWSTHVCVPTSEVCFSGPFVGHCQCTYISDLPSLQQ